MKIALTSSLFYPTPPREYGSVERVAGYLADELAGMGLDVTLYASGDSPTVAKLRPTTPVHLMDRSAHGPVDAVIRRHYATVAREIDDYDIVNVHTLFLEYMEPLLAVRDRLLVSTSGFTRSSAAELAAWRDVPAVSLTDNQRRHTPPMNWCATIGLGVPRHIHHPNYRRGNYLVYIGRMGNDKAVHRAIRVAHAFGMQLKIIGPWKFGADGPYRDRVVAPLLDYTNIDYLGEVDEDIKQAVLRDAFALILPTERREAFGLALIEAMACGTPAIGWQNTAIPEVIDHGISGFVVDSLGSALRALEQVKSMDRRQVRAQFEKRFTIERVALQYYTLYRRVLRQRAGRAA